MRSAPRAGPTATSGRSRLRNGGRRSSGRMWVDRYGLGETVGDLDESARERVGVLQDLGRGLQLFRLERVDEPARDDDTRVPRTVPIGEGVWHPVLDDADARLGNAEGAAGFSVPIGELRPEGVNVRPVRLDDPVEQHRPDGVLEHHDRDGKTGSRRHHPLGRQAELPCDGVADCEDEPKRATTTSIETDLSLPIDSSFETL
jgi:hypothetical protein